MKQRTPKFIAAFRPFFTIIFALILSLLGPGLPAQDTEIRIWMGATINGQPARFALDTGASASFIFDQAAQRLGLKVDPPPADTQLLPGQVALGITEPCNISFGDHHERSQLDVFTLPPGLHPGEDGLISWKAFHNCYIELNIGGNHASFLDQRPAISPRALQLPVARKLDVLGLEFGNTTGTPSIILIDTGADDGVTLSADLWQTWRAAHPSSPTTLDASFMPGEGLTVREESWASELTIGPLTLQNVLIRPDHSLYRDMAGSGYVATLSYFALQQLRIVVDTQNSVAYIEHNPAAASSKLPQELYQYNRLGAVFVPDHPATDDLVAHVVKDSPAYAAGIRDGDLLLRVNDLDATQWRTDPKVLPLSRFWFLPSKTILDLKLKRGDREFEATPTLQEILATKPPTP
jgi:hypothetical protein